MITLEDVKKNSLVDAYSARISIWKSSAIRSTAAVTAAWWQKNARGILLDLGLPEREAELTAIAGYLHDIGHVFNRVNHSFTGAVLAHTLLLSLNMAPDEITQIVAAIGSHDEASCEPVSNNFEIFLSRMLYCRRAANFLGCEFSLVANGNRLP
jgi:hypothetical protein